MVALSENEITAHLTKFEGWAFKDNAIHTSFEFDNFKDAFSIMTRLAFEAEKLNHHPDWSNVYNKLYISLSTHEAGGVTEKDFQLAEIIDSLVS